MKKTTQPSKPTKQPRTLSASALVQIQGCATAEMYCENITVKFS